MRQRELFIAALQKENAKQRAAFLDAACRDDVALRNQLEALLAQHQKEASFFLDAPVPGLTVTKERVAAAEQLGQRIGRYRLKEEIGDGGMGVVYVAEQEEPVRRKVALKIIKPGMDTRQVVARFEAERQALAMMDHPNIAQVYDGGTTESGRPYFVMELVRGVPITEFCDDHKLTTRQRLELFVDVCQAIQHAHQKGLIHRDIKPSNVLVTLHDDQSVVKMIDFGVAKAIRHELVLQTVYTNFAQLIGTPLYMSPEQAEMNALDVDTRSDIYSLGVLLYELLTGITPFDPDLVQQAGFDEMRRMIREDDPPAPSQKVTTLDAQALSTACQRRRVDQRQLPRMLRGELDWIVMKALEKNRNRRYETPSALARDVRRYLDHEQVEASPPSRWYRTSKFLYRHRVLMAAMLAVVAALSLGAAAATWSALAAIRARNEARVSAQRAHAAEQQASRHLDRSLNAVDRMLVRVGDEQLKDIPFFEPIRYELLEDAVELYDQFLQDAPQNQRLQLTTAVTERRKAKALRLLGRTGEAREPIERSVRLQREQLKLAPADPQLRLELSRSLRLLGGINNDLAPVQEAVAILRVLESEGNLPTDAIAELPMALSSLAVDTRASGNRKQAEQLMSDADQAFRRVIDRLHDDHALRRAYAKHLCNFGGFYLDDGKWQDAESKYDEAVKIGASLTSSSQDAEDVLVYATTLMNRGIAKARRMAVPKLLRGDDDSTYDYVDADRDYDQALALYRQLVQKHPSIPAYRQYLAQLLMNRIHPSQGYYERNMPFAEEAVQIWKGLVADYPTEAVHRCGYGGALSNMANLMAAHRRDMERGEQLVQEAIRQQQRALELRLDDPTPIHFLANHYAVLADLLTKQGRADEVINVCGEGLQFVERLRKSNPDNELILFLKNHLQDMRAKAEEQQRGENEEASHAPP